MKYVPVIGLEIHAELKTTSKIYCSCKNSFGQRPNTQVCPVCMGAPGALPSLNKKAVQLAIKAGLLLNCSISKESRMDRKNYFYPDLPKGYQITQNTTPLCFGGYIELNSKKININRIHIEDDAGKLIHTENGKSSVDFNRSGVPLIEIVTEPDITSADEAIEFLEALKRLLEYAEISDCKMQEGSFRCDVNVSLRFEDSKVPSARCEIKNLNSFTAVKSAIDYEIKRQAGAYNSGNNVLKETRRWAEDKKITVAMRSKEDTSDYMYFPEPDILPVIISDEEIEKIKSTLCELPASRKNRFIKDFNLSEYDADIITSKKSLADFFESCISCGADAKTTLNWLMGDVSKILKEKALTFDEIPFDANALASLIHLVKDEKISNSAAKIVLGKMFVSCATPEKIANDLLLLQISDEEQIKSIVVETIKENPKSYTDFKNGNKRAFAFLVGQAMKKSKGRANPKILNNVLSEILQK